MEAIKYGPGVWFSIHLLALNAQDTCSKKVFIKYMERLKETFPCAKCRKHMERYMNANPIQEFWDKENGFFKWSWIFHNAVNIRLGKKFLDYEEALNLYTDNIIACNKGCDESSSIELVYNKPNKRQVPRNYYIPNMYK